MIYNNKMKKKRINNTSKILIHKGVGPIKNALVKSGYLLTLFCYRTVALSKTPNKPS